MSASSPFVVVTSGAESVRSSSAAPSVCGSVAPSASSASAAAGSMSLIRALDEVVLLDKRITKKINEATFLGVMSKKSRAIQNADEFSAQCKGDWQSLSDLINRRNRIKSAIIVSNAATMVKVSGETLSVAEVIERKKSLTLQRDLLTRLKAQRESSLRSLETHNSQMEAELSKLLEIHFGKGGNSKTSASDIEDISRPFRESNAARLLDPLAADQRIRELETYIDEFEREAKFTLSEANAMTRIQVA